MQMSRVQRKGVENNLLIWLLREARCYIKIGVPAKNTSCLATSTTTTKNIKTHKQNPPDPPFRNKPPRTDTSSSEIPVSQIYRVLLLLFSKATRPPCPFSPSSSVWIKATSPRKLNKHTAQVIVGGNVYTVWISELVQLTSCLNRLRHYAAYLRFAVKQWNCVVHYPRHDILFASPDYPWQVDSPCKLFGLPKEIKIDFILLILGSSNPQAGVSKCLPHTSPRNNTVLAQMLMKSRERGVHLQLKWDYLEKLPKYLWINFPINNVIPAAEVYGKEVHLSPAGLEHSHFHLRTSYHNFCSISKHHPGQCEHYGKDHRSSSRRLHLIRAVEAVKKQYRMWHLAVHGEWIGMGQITVAQVLEKMANLWRHYVFPFWGLYSSSEWKRWVPWGGPVLVWEEWKYNSSFGFDSREGSNSPVWQRGKVSTPWNNEF